MERETFFIGIKKGKCRICCKEKVPETSLRKPLSETKHREITCLQGYNAKYFCNYLKIGRNTVIGKYLTNNLKKLIGETILTACLKDRTCFP